MDDSSPLVTPGWRWRALRQSAVEWCVILLFGGLYCAALLAADGGLTLRGLAPDSRLQGVEHERLSGILIPVAIGLGLSDHAPGIGHLPAWNPYLGTGTPLINNAFLYLFNPFMSLPVLLLGAVQGGKVALLLGLLLAGINMWALARAVGLGRAARVLTGALYMLSGGLLARFYTGHFQLGLSLVWLPLVFAGLWWTLQSRRRLAPVLLATAFALLFFSGNIYYSLHALVGCAVITGAHSVSREAGRWQLHGDRLGRVALGGILAFGLTCIQFLPLWLVRESVDHQVAAFDPATGQLAGNYLLGQSVANFIQPWTQWSQLQNPPNELLAAVDYAYIGPAPFLILLGLAFTGLKRHRRAFALALLLALLFMTWGAGQTAVLSELYRRLPLLAEFRYLGRAHAVAGLWWILLAGIAFDHLWRAAASRRAGARLARGLAAAVSLWGGLLVYSLADHSTRFALALNNIHLFNALNARRFVDYLQAADALLIFVAAALLLDVLLPPWGEALRGRLLRLGLVLLALTTLLDALHNNRPLIQFGPPANQFDRLYAFASSADPGPFPAILEPSSPTTYNAYARRVRVWGLNEGWIPRPVPGDLIPGGAPRLMHLPGWAIVSTEFQGGHIHELAQAFVEQHNGVRELCITRAARAQDPCDLDTYPGSVLYQIPGALPYAFLIDERTLVTQADTVRRDYPGAVEFVRHELDTITMRVNVPDDGRRYYLIVQETHFPGWHAEQDGAAVEVFTVGAQTPGGGTAGWLAVAMLPGTHTVTLRYEPPGFAAGGLISGLTLAVMLAWLSRLDQMFIRTRRR
jgi:hypothetical protein